LLCHACNNAKCSNPRHLYWGTDRENIVLDNPNHKNVGQRTIEKYGVAGARAKWASGNKSAGGLGNKGKPKSEEHKKKIAEAIRRKYNKE
jgi:hypothetical protein